MEKKKSGSVPLNKKYAAICGLYCEACSWFIATTEEPKRRQRLAEHFRYSEEEAACYGCRSNKRLPYCENCRMFACAAERGLSTYDLRCRKYSETSSCAYVARHREAIDQYRRKR